MMKIPHFLLAVLILAPSSCAGADDRSGKEDNPAYAWHDSMLAAMGGEQAWKEARYISFRWQVLRHGEVVSDRAHYWDRWDGRYRLETRIRANSQMQADQSLVALFDVDTREGRAWVDGQPYTNEMGDQLVERAHAMFINDTYWLLMPYKWRDPGVTVEYLGPEVDDDGEWRVFHLSFDDVGLTPGDQYWVYVSAQPPHLVGKWQYHLEGRESKGPVIYWKNWRGFGPIQLATTREVSDGSFSIQFSDIEVSDRPPAAIFEPPTTN